MFFRLLIFTILGLVIYRVVKSRLISTGHYNNPNVNLQAVDDVMIKDPICGAYFAQRNGVTLNTSQEVVYFCSNECREKYAAQQSKSQ
jgi:YHS domain-containing protein